MADVLSVIADIIKQDKQQKREHAKVMREVQKKLKEKEADASEDVSDFMGAASQAAADGKKEFEFPPGSGKMYPVTIKDKDTAKKIAKKMDDEDEQEEETTLSQRVKDRMKAEQEDDEEETLSTPDQDAEVDGEEDEDDDPVGGEPSEDQIDKIADLVVQKLKDKADEEEDEEDEPEETEAEKGEEEEINTRPKMEAVRNPHARNTWEEALRKVYFKEEKVPEPIPEVIKNVGKELRNYAMKSGGIDRDDFLKISKTLMQGKMPKANMINKMDTDPREFVFDLMAKTMGWKYVEQYGGIRFQHRTDYVESFQGGHVLQEHCGECGAMDHIEEKFEVKYASSKKGPIKVSTFKTLDDAKKFLAQVKGEGMNGIISKGGKPVKEDEDLEKIVKELEKASQTHLGQSKRIKKHLDKMKEEVEIDEKMDGRKKFSGAQAKKDNEARRAAQRKKLGILGPNEEVELDENKYAMGDPARAEKELDKEMKKAMNMKSYEQARAHIGDFLMKLDKKYPKSDAYNTDTRSIVTDILNKKFKTNHDLHYASDSSELKFLKKKKPAPLNIRRELDMGEEVELDEKKSDYEDQIKAFLAKGGKIQKGDKPNQRKIDKVTKGFMKKFGTMKKKEAELDAKDKEELEKMMGEELVTEAWIDKDARKVERKWSKMDKRAKKKWMDGIMAKAKKEGMPKDELMDVLDDYGLTMEETSNLNKLDDWGIDLRKEGYMVMPAIDREKYTPMRGLEGPFPTFSGKVLYYDPKAGMYYDRDSDIYLSYDAYLEYDKISPSQQKQMKLGPFGDPKSKEYKSMERIKKKVAKLAKRDQLKNESVGLRLARKFYQKEKDNGGS